MAMRYFTDQDGTEWTAWDVTPQSNALRIRSGGDGAPAGPSSGLQRMTDGLQDGWLCFECEGEKRRLAPRPDDWAEAPDAALHALLAAATPVLGRARTTFRTERETV